MENTISINPSMSCSQRLGWLEKDPLDELREMRLQMASRGADVIDLSMLNPDMPPPRFLLDRLVEGSLKPANHRYAVSRGVRKLREAFAHKYMKSFGVKLDPENQICATMGTKDALMHALLVIAEPGSVVLIGSPAYPAHAAAARMAGLSSCFFELQPDEDAMLDDIRRQLELRNVKIVLLNFPNNPTGLSVTNSFYEKLLAMTRQRGVFVLNDFVYGEMGFSSLRPPSLLACSTQQDLTAESYSLSKAYNVAGWRVGALAGHVETIRKLSRLKAFIDYGIFLPVQFAACAALTAGWDLVAATVAEYQERAKVLCCGLNQLGWDARMPSAGASVWARIPEIFKRSAGAEAAGKGRLSLWFARQLLAEEELLITPGALFGCDSDEYVRFALVVPVQSLREVLAKIRRFGLGFERAAADLNQVPVNLPG